MSDEVADCLRSLTDDEIAIVEKLSDEGIMKALDKGRKERDLFEKCLGGYCPAPQDIFYK